MFEVGARWRAEEVRAPVAAIRRAIYAPMLPRCRRAPGVSKTTDGIACAMYTQVKRHTTMSEMAR